MRDVKIRAMAASRRTACSRVHLAERGVRLSSFIIARGSSRRNRKGHEMGRQDVDQASAALVKDLKQSAYCSTKP
jgi:hypothetical protein